MATLSAYMDELLHSSRRAQPSLTRHAVTMPRQFHVTLGEQGVSQPVSVDLKAAEIMAA